MHKYIYVIYISIYRERDREVCVRERRVESYIQGAGARTLRDHSSASFSEGIDFCQPLQKLAWEQARIHRLGRLFTL